MRRIPPDTDAVALSVMFSQQWPHVAALIRAIRAACPAVPIVVDAGLGAPSQAAEALEMGASAVLVNTAIAIAPDPVRMARAFAKAVEAGREAYEIGLSERLDFASATSPLSAFFSSAESR